MKNPVEIKDQELLHKLIRGGRTNLLEWFERIPDQFCEERTMEERVFIESIKERFYNDFIEQFLCSLPTLLFKFLMNRGACHIVEPHPLLIESPYNTNWVEKQKVWEKFVEEREWDYFLRK